MAEKEAIEEAQRKLRSEFLQVLRSRRPSQVPLTVELAKPVATPLFQDAPPSIKEIEIMESCPKSDVENLEDLLEEENLYLNVELKESDKQRKRPAVVFLHRSYSNKESMRPLLKVWDLIKLADYLTHREDIDPSRIGISGESFGGMHAWFAAVADTRYAVVVPLIGVQGFRWAIDNDKWQARVNSIKPLFEVARDDLGKDVIDKEVVEKVWDRIAPGLASQFDSPYSIPTIAPRPLLILGGAEDRRCPVAGLEIPRSMASQAYGEFQCLDNLKVQPLKLDVITRTQRGVWLGILFRFIAEPGIWHRLTRFQVKESSDWFDRFLNP
ncbi:hypothetical protein JHK86_014729 [Glycine max]|nr:hypothetical protein JHK86_014729 [Glycine max]